MLREEHSERQERLRLIPVEERRLGLFDMSAYYHLYASYGDGDVSEISLSPVGEERKAAQALQEELARSWDR